MSDYISRDAAIKYACENCEPNSCDGACELVQILKHLPAADVVARDCFDRLLAENDELRKVRPVVQAKWEDVHIDRPEIADLEVASMFCPNCNRWYNKVYHYGNPIEFVNFCSFCGADMREEKHEN